MRTLRVLLPVLMLLLILASRHAFAGTITAEAFGLSSPSPAGVAPFTNGDFTIDTLFSLPVGDGEDDVTTWSLGFSGTGTVTTLRDLVIGDMTLTLTPGDSLFASDQFRIDGLPWIEDSAFRTGQTVGVTKTVTFSLLNHYTGSEILGALTAGGGVLPMTYQDDATVSYARLDLMGSTVPLPSAALAGLGLFGLIGAAHRYRKRRAG